MADVRSLLRNERASRRIVHPLAAYSPTGALTCTVCHTQLKADSLWENHLISGQHVLQRQRIRDSTAGQAPKPMQVPTNGGNKKRKADDGEETMKKKKAKAQNDLPESFFEVDAQEAESESNSQAELAKESSPAASEPLPSINPTKTVYGPSNHSTSNNISSRFFDTPSEYNDSNLIDESEWAAFKRDVATPPPPASALTSAATISAAPLTAAEIAAHAREQESLQNKERMEAVIEGEKEDAERRLEEEFDEMAELEKRLRRLREKREALRMARREEMVGVREEVNGAEDEGGGPGVIGIGGHDADDDHDDNTGSDDNDDWNNWGL